MKTQNKLSEEFFKRSQEVSPGGVHSPVRAFKGVGGIPRFIAYAKGTKLSDVDGNTYLDFCLSWGPLLFGHQDEEIKEAVIQALHQGWSFGAAETKSLELAELITETIPWVEKVRFVNSGTEAVMSVLRVARAFSGKNKILKFNGCYHGHADSLLVKAGSGLAEMASPDSAGVSPHTASETIVAPLNDFKILQDIVNLHAEDLAAIIIEPLPANNGLLLQTDTFLKQVATLCKEKKILLIFDEVISGFRTAMGGMAETLGIRPDLVTYGKIIGGGFPVGAYGGKSEIMDLVAPSGPVYQAGTLSANPVSMTAGLSMLKKIKRENPFSKLETHCKNLGKSVEEVFAKILPELPHKVQSFASIFWLVLGDIPSADQTVRSIDQIPTRHKTVFTHLFHELLSRGVYLAPSAFEVSFLCTQHGKSDFDFFISSLEESLKNLKGRF